MRRLKIDDPDFQIQLVILMVESEKFLREHRDHIEAGWFEDEGLRRVVGELYSFSSRYKKNPSWAELKCLSDHSKPADRKSYKSLVKSLENESRSSRRCTTFVADHVMEFVRLQNYRAAILASVKALDNQDYEMIPRLFREAESRNGQISEGLKFSSRILERLTKREIRKTISTKIEELDKYLQGGHARSELSLVLAPPARGKTTMLINIGWAALLGGFNVHHFFAEQTERLIAARYESRFLNRPIREVLKTPHKSAHGLKRLLESCGELFVVSCRKLSVEAIRAMLYRVQTPPDLVIVDYADKLVPAHRYREKRWELSGIYEDLYDLASEFDCSVWTASQTNRSGLSKSRVDMSDLAEDFNKAAIADNLIALCQTPREKTTNDLRLFLAKVRNAESDKEIHCKINRSTAAIISRRAALGI